jgi:hypothetical protein
VRRVLRALLLSGAATAMVLAGAGGAVVLLSPRVEQLEARCSQVGCRGRMQQRSLLASRTENLVSVQ